MESPIILFDGECKLCDATVQFVIRRDTKGVFRFAALQSPNGQAILKRFGLLDSGLDSIVMVEGDRFLTHSTAALTIGRRLGLPWSLASVFLIVPRFIRDAVYKWIARNRYRWFGRYDQCLMPTPEIQSRFLDG